MRRLATIQSHPILDACRPVCDNAAYVRHDPALARLEGQQYVVKPLRRASLALLALLVCLLLVLAACSGAGSGGAVGTIAPGFPANAAHPQPQDADFNGCPPQGDGGDSQLNVRKNRIDNGENGAFHDVDLGTLLALQWPQTVERQSRDNWSSSDAAAIAQYEGVAVRTTGYVLGVRHEGTESPNCHDVNNTDFHVWLAVNASDGKDKSMVVEVTPRVRALRSGWDDATLSGLTGQHVRISGWLMFDQEHPEQLGKTRMTLFEIHPILHIEVDNNGTWQSIDG
jgi:hypothetical protein